MFVRRQVEQNAEQEVQQYMNNGFDGILYFEDAAYVVSSIIHAVKWDFVSCISVYFIWYSYKIIL